MTDLVDWYNQAEQEGKLSPVELAALFHYRYIRIHPFEDGNGRIARLMVNFILARHGYPMIVVRSRLKQHYLEALHKADLIVGATPADGAHASLKDIRPFHKYMSKLIAEEVANDVLFVTERNENVWWYDGQRIAFRTATYSKILRTMQIEDQATQAYLQEETGINRSALQKMIATLLDKGYITRDDNGRWRVFLTPSVY
jgi:Fic family protein